MEPKIISVNTWIQENKKYFLPPVCNKMFHNEQLKVFFVGGPNQRKDFHLEEGEEFFYQLTGDMCLVVLENGKFRDIHIKQGEVFLLPGMIPHSPQRQADTVGLVIERERMKNEKDCLRYFVEGTTESLFERWFYCEDLGVQLGPVIKEYFASEQHRTGRPIPGTISENPPWVPDSKRVLKNPFPLHSWLLKHRKEIDLKGFKSLFGEDCQSDVFVLGRAEHYIHSVEGDTWLWQLEGSCDVELHSVSIQQDSCEVHVKNETKILQKDDSILIPKNVPYTSKRAANSLTLSVTMDPAKKDRGFKHLRNN